MKIYLLGYMGCGKSTVGKKLAARLGYAFIDLDVFIEKREGRSVSELFDEEGEIAFRDREHESLKKVAESDRVVIATGGGTPCYNDNLAIINRSGISIYLEMEVGALRNRLWNAKTSRPLIKNKSKEELLEFIRVHLHAREFFYKQAHHTVNAKSIQTGQLIALLTDQTR